MLKIARQAAFKAGKLAQRMRSGKLGAKTKSAVSDLVTPADLAAEKLIVKSLERNFPKHNILTEESGFTNKDSEFTWVIDPIDGTICYFGGLPFWGISIGLYKRKKPYLGVVFLPDFNQMFSAQKNKGAFLNEKPIRVSKEDELSKAIVASDLGYAHRKDEIKNCYTKFVDSVRYPPICGSSVYACMNVACGKFGAYLHTEYIWDIAASAAIIEEAGGKISDYKGNNIDWAFNNKTIDVLASNKSLDNDLVKLMK